MMLSREAITAAVEAHIEAGDFYKPAHGADLRSRARRCTRRGEPVDPVTMAEELRRAGQLDALGGSQALLRIQAVDPGVGELGALRADRLRARDAAAPHRDRGRHPGDGVHERGRRRRDARPRRVADLRGRRAPRRRHARAAAPGARGDDGPARERSTTATRRSSACRTGYHDLDELLLGLQPSTLSIVAARPGQGKTSFALGAALHVALDAPQAGAVLLDGDGPPRAHEAPARGRSADRRRASCTTGRLSEHEWPKLNQAVGRLAEAPFFIDDNPHCTVMEMRAKARRIEGEVRRPRA